MADEYDAYDDFGALNDADFAVLDAASLQAMPRIAIEVESGRSQPMLSPMARYRGRRTLSVTDISSLAWCEVQFDYGLQQRRSRRLKDRPRSFKSENTGKEIVVQQDVAARNDKTTKRGQFIHKELERELKPAEVQVVITSEEERWGLRILNFLSSLFSLAVENCTREIPVFGLVNGIAVVGIIDELQIESNTIHVIDTKTRRSHSLPSEDDTEPTKVQLMLYHRLISVLLNPHIQFDYPAFWNQLGLDGTKTFSAVFVDQMRDVLGNTDVVPSCLQDLAALLDLRVAEMRLPPLNPDLTVVYRSQNKYPAPLRRDQTVPALSVQQPQETEEQELARAIVMSLTSEAEAAQIAVFQAQLQQALLECRRDPEPEATPAAAAAIIGTKHFPMDDPALDAYLQRSMDWWLGRRKAQGVEERQTRRCLSCEYSNDCEWREQKAAEKLESARRKREAMAGR
ncbi:hypothetical protein HMN09_00874600 [Mycena chlorophos]|uniref:Exonuclease V n=1 Tax=Mycena chlorophos TaxID=658473 RepID=A0A8H6SNT0_MYCCL|nr:hypothetical protein HMN09_00874600 [Mycena chlorophos]